MKTFYEATDIKSKLKLDISIKLTPVDYCNCLVKVNKQILWDAVMINSRTFVTSVGLTNPINFSIFVTRHHPQAINIEDISIDGYSIIPLYQHYAIPITSYVDFNGEWKLQIPNFYPWYHEITGQGWIA